MALKPLLHQTELHIWPALVSCDRAVEWFNINPDSELGSALREAMVYLDKAIEEIRKAEQVCLNSDGTIYR